jgi:hypothetical protein
MSSNDKSLPNLIKDIIFYYVKFYYDKYLKDNAKSHMTDADIDAFIQTHYSDKVNEVRTYVRNSLKKNLADNYNSVATENILLEIFNDPAMAKERIKLEIVNYQKTKALS